MPSCVAPINRNASTVLMDAQVPHSLGGRCARGLGLPTGSAHPRVYVFRFLAKAGMDVTYLFALIGDCISAGVNGGSASILRSVPYCLRKS